MKLRTLICITFLLVGCEGQQSALAPAGREAETLADLFWVMLTGAVLIWLLVIGLSIYLTRFKTGEHAPRLGHALILGGGVAFPTITLIPLIAYGVGIMPDLREPEMGDGVRIAMTGERWWWRVQYQLPGADEPIVAANELRLPVGERTDFVLDSADVIHSFWVPSLAGKIDMFPGRETFIALEPTQTGVYRGQCAEFCGQSHALMAFATVVMEPDAFARWLAEQAEPAAEPETPLAARGRDIFLSVGCGACHTIRGTPANGNFGPDLTHVGSRETLGAGILPNEPEDFAEWIAHTGAIKPDVNMPSFQHLGANDIQALAAYLEGLD